MPINVKFMLTKVYNHESLVGFDLRNLYLSFINFSGLQLRSANLEGGCLSHALLEDCDLTNANLSNVNLGHASFNRAQMAEASVTDAIADGASFREVKGLTSATKDYLKSKGAKGLE